MAVNKNFVVKNGLEVNTNLIVADAITDKVGIGTTVPEYTLHVANSDGSGGIGATHISVTGVGTFGTELRVGTGGTIFSVIAGPSGVGQSVGIRTAEPAYLLDVRSPVSTGETALYVQGDVRFTGITTSESTVFASQLSIGGISTFVGFATFNDYVYVQDGLNVTGPSTFTGIGTFISDLYIGGDLYINQNVILDTNLNILGIATIGTLDVTNYSDFGLGIDVAGAGSTTTTLTVSGVSTFTGSIDANGDVDIDGHTELDNLNVSGFSTFASLVDINDYVTISDGLDVAGAGSTTTTLNVSGVSTFVGFSTFGDYVFIQDGLNVAGPSTSNSYTVNGTQVISAARELQNIASLDATTTATIEAAIANAPNTFTDITVTGISTLGVTSATNLTAQQLDVSGITTLGVTNVSQLNSVGVVTATGGFNLGISSAGTTITSGPVTTLNFVGTGNTFAVNGTTIDISIQGGGAGAGGTWSTYNAGIATSKSVGVNTSTLDDNDLVGVGNSFQGLYVGNGMIIVDNQLNGDHYIGTNFNGLMAGPVTINGTLTVDGNYVVV